MCQCGSRCTAGGLGIWKCVELHLVVIRLGEWTLHHLASAARNVRGPAKGRTVPTRTVPPKRPRAFPSGNACVKPDLPPEKVNRGTQLLRCGSVREVQRQGRKQLDEAGQGECERSTLSHSSLMQMLLQQARLQEGEGEEGLRMMDISWTRPSVYGDCSLKALY